ncbi:NTF2-related export protein 2-like isoform X2 [Octopus vulgaris]|uniref:NTF2-related export protein 2-like isoform X2 n=2 Tax=Octopus TaxID=6643 RepID=A0AA36BCY5_OCTVU|nr:NTF2-related export protein 2 isoform X2 [Octopus bimaculoides]XP_029644025.1 NTF2-related export protein 2 isoform X2 [Octopus sinensis]CAI9732136.1 NTF2-related export protein 2-like isoform X2 [Octopus vulgaris]|eukprot:XP_014787483.1 PREDICTED: NTF2-related export protein 2-like isoform X2 [Octopus bimaculoides]
MALGSAGEELKTKIDQACTAGEEFHKLYYETFDKRRHLLSKLYMTNAQMVWNGTFVEGMTEIMKFIEHLPSTETSVETFDCHPLADVVSQGQTTIGVTTFGLVKFPRKKSKAFHQHFILTSQENVWKIVSDNYRFVE